MNLDHSNHLVQTWGSCNLRVEQQHYSWHWIPYSMSLSKIQLDYTTFLLRSSISTACLSQSKKCIEPKVNTIPGTVSHLRLIARGPNTFRFRFKFPSSSIRKSVESTFLSNIKSYSILSLDRNDWSSRESNLFSSRFIQNKPKSYSIPSWTHSCHDANVVNRYDSFTALGRLR